MQTSGSSGEADLMVPITGPKGEGKLYVMAEKQGGVWQYELLQVELAGQGGRVDLLTGGSSSGDI